MKKIVCNYAPIRFLPYRETGEFVNMGIVAHFPQVGRFEFKVETRKIRRVINFFPELDRHILRKSTRCMIEYLEQIPLKGLEPAQQVNPSEVDQGIARFQELVRHREGLIHFGPGGTQLIEDPAQALEDLFRRFVERQFAKTPEYQEKIMGETLNRCLKKWNLTHFYERNKQIGTHDFHLVIPFVHFTKNVPQRIIKPLNLNRDEASEITDHGGIWLSRFARLNRNQHLPKKVVLPVQLPEDPKRRKVADGICNEFKELGFDLAEFTDKCPLAEEGGQIERLHHLVSVGLS